MKRSERRRHQCIHPTDEGLRCENDAVQGRPHGWLCKEHELLVYSEEFQVYQALPPWRKRQLAEAR